jgi:hypothetical protein
MPRFSLRTLTLVMLLGGPVCAASWAAGVKAVEYWRQRSQPQCKTLMCGGCVVTLERHPESESELVLADCGVDENGAVYEVYEEVLSEQSFIVR